MNLDIFVTITHITDTHYVCSIHTISDSIETYRTVSYEYAMLALRKLEKISGQFPTMEINRYDRDIWTKSLWVKKRA